jgi:hypothetical protein
MCDSKQVYLYNFIVLFPKDKKIKRVRGLPQQSCIAGWKVDMRKNGDCIHKLSASALHKDSWMTFQV